MAEHDTLVSAADALHVSPSALSVALDELDRTLGVQITVRRRAHGVRLTPAGRIAVTHARRLLRDADQLVGAVGGTVGAVAGTIAVGCYPTLAPTLLAPWIATMARRHPGVSVEFVEQDQTELRLRLLRGELDLAVLHDFHLEPALETRRLVENVPYLLVGSSHRLAGEQSVDLAAVGEEPMILLDLPPSSEHALGVCHDLGVRPDVAHRTRSVEMVRALVGAGMGWSILAHAMAPDLPGTSVVTRVPLAREPAPLPVVAAWSRTTRPNPVVRAMLDTWDPHPTVALPD